MPSFESRVMGTLRKQKKAAISLSELAKKSNVGKKDKDVLVDFLERLEQENKLINQNGRYTLAENLGLVPAGIVKVNATFGFAKPDSPDYKGKDVFVPGRFLLGAMPGDTVLLRVKKSTGELPEGEVYKISRESGQRFSGTLKIEGEDYNIIPDRYVNFPIKLAKRGCEGMHDGDKILATLINQGSRHAEHVAIAIACFGDGSKASACCASILAANDIYPEFPMDVQEQAKAIGSVAGIHPKELAVRVDLRDDTIFTIDGADTKDIDDAVSLEKNAKGWLLGVHIADVSHYVTYKTPLDSEAYQRGTSVYYADSVIPMLPKELSNGICSLNPDEDRLAFSCLIQLDPDAKIESYEFKKTVIRSHIKGVYHEINDIFANNASDDVREKYAKVTEMLAEMDVLAKRLTQNRLNRGGVDLESVESKITVDENGTPTDIKPRVQGASEMIIEEFMLVANECASRFATKEHLPFVFRVHENPAPDKLTQLFEVLTKLGVSFKPPQGKVTSEQLGQILKQVKGSEVDEIVNTLILRSMAKAKYSERNIGHFGLALDDYTHFTSPIRRYPDLTIHRILSAYVTGMRHDNISKRFGTFVAQSSSRSTEREVAAMTAERDCENAYKAEFMQGHIGEKFEGIISSVTQFGIYVRLENTVEGLVRTQSLPQGDWQFDGLIAFADTLGKGKMQLGDKVEVIVAACDVSAGHVDFEMVNTVPQKG